MTKKVVRLTESDLEKIVRRVIKESMGVGFMSGEPNGLKIKKMETAEQTMATGGDDAKVKYRNLVAKVDQFLPFDIKQLQDVANKVKAGEGVLIDVIQPFLKIQKLLEKVNSEGYRMATSTGWKDYKSPITNQSVSGNDKTVYLTAINDLIGIKGALRNKAAEMSGLAATLPQWAKSELGRKILDNYANMAGLNQA
jgi:hypothetical protein